MLDADHDARFDAACRRKLAVHRCRNMCFAAAARMRRQ